MAFFPFLEEIGVCALLLVLLLFAVLVGRKIKSKKLRIILFVVFFAVTLISEFVFRAIENHASQFFMIAIQFVAVPACLGFGISVFLEIPDKALQ